MNNFAKVHLFGRLLATMVMLWYGFAVYLIIEGALLLLWERPWNYFILLIPFALLLIIPALPS